jgi:N-acetylglucosaminyldiphosphoundecaprenol N-acetyl-beta-D-mannosaminyltransferase
MPKALELVDRLVKGEKLRNTIFAINARKIISLDNDISLKTFFENSALIIADGIGVVWAVRWLLGKVLRRITGVDLMLNICRKAAEKGYKIFILGAKEEVNSAAVEKLKSIYPGLPIVGRSNGYIPKEQFSELTKKINCSGAEILFLALGSPKQEKFLQEYLPQLNVKICQGIGGTLDVISGTKKRAPLFFQKIGLEWLHRYLSDPSRYRNIKYLVLFTIKLLRTKLLSNGPVSS